MTKLVLGKGLGALIPTDDGSSVVTEFTQFAMLVLDEIAPNPMQPRHEFDTDKLNELAQSLKENGLMQPLVVKKAASGYTIIAGERRYRAARLAGFAEVPVVIMDASDDTKMLELALVENIHRQDLNPIELAEAYRRLIEHCNFTQQQLANKIGKGRVVIANTMRLLTLPPQIQQLLRAGALSEGHGRAMLALESEPKMLEMADRIINGSLSVRQTEQESISPRAKKKRLLPKRHLPALAEVETSLKQLLGTSVKIHPGLKRGRIEIDYYGEDDLDRLWDLFKRIDKV
ncbi:MAG: ParB/RepB/Spo0J family partition protein [candidate division Zixibacteria bacterium]|nr:ParB/RepB/Spo0J family partition protein [candidate division Zixibacteria bacterium]